MSFKPQGFLFSNVNKTTNKNYLFFVLCIYFNLYFILKTIALHEGFAFFNLI